ncbi:hypothetical protein D8674_028754 [Pyrus ussuriensis x Pyrus communis]|uniref:MULE transposase domain-containing protein n=1 Tax=Pyrus ussuriensis x Pyrus communis TaxID=2448454 RepID=A0A5N5I074_9ROSA|nr:hypothetical protein D8674_028754 [Pyrus ussuriensis x Pyrus communis]
MMSSKVVSSDLMEQASSKPMLKPTKIVKDFKKYYGLDISQKKMMHGSLACRYGKNGNQGIYPLAFAVVNSENEENWSWFLQKSSKIVTPQGRTITFISVTTAVFPQSPHAFCYHHLKQNILLKYRSSLGGAVMRDFLKTPPKENWAAAHFPSPKYSEMCSNVAESFNAWIVDQRFLPIYQMLDGIRAKIMEMNAQRRRVAEGWKTFLCLEMETIMQDLLEYGRHWDVGRSNIDRYAPEENEEMLINPSLTKKPPGRPRVKRIKSSGERTRPIACSRCETLGHHNRKTCTAEI